MRGGGKTNLAITPQLEVFFWFELDLGLYVLWLLGSSSRSSRFDALSDVAEDLAGAQHAVCVEAVVAECSVSAGGGLEGEGEGDVPV